jgi:hypothetical protein
MNLAHSPNTCSMTELCGLYANTEDEFQKNLQNLITEANSKSRKCIYACMHKYTQDRFQKILKDAGFVFIGRYPGNSESWVHLWVYGLEVPKPVLAAKPKAAAKKLTLRNTLSRVRKPIQK